MGSVQQVMSGIGKIGLSYVESLVVAGGGSGGSNVAGGGGGGEGEGSV